VRSAEKKISPSVTNERQHRRMKLRRYIVLRDGVVTKFPWIVVSADEGEPAPWQQNVHIGKMPLRFRTAELAQAAADQLMAEQRKK